MSKTFTVIIDDETMQELRRDLINREEFTSDVINKMKDKDIICNSVYFYIQHIEENI